MLQDVVGISMDQCLIAGKWVHASGGDVLPLRNRRGQALGGVPQPQSVAGCCVRSGARCMGMLMTLPDLKRWMSASR